MTEIRPQSKQELFLRSNADITIYGGSAGGGKSFALIIDPLRYKHVPGFGAVLFRRTIPEITREGGMWDETRNIYPQFGAVANQVERKWTFPSGAKITLSGLQYSNDLKTWRGAQIAMMGFDQLETFERDQFIYLLHRNRSVCGVKPYVRATCNPEPGWLADMLAWWIAEDGYADLSRSGKKRWFVMDNDVFVWGDTKDELNKEYPDINPRSMTFIPATIYDNQILMEKDPNYIATLQGLSVVDRERLLGDRDRGGNWKIKPSAGNVFNRAWFEIIGDWDREDRHWKAVLRFDLAATAPTVDSPDPDYSAWCVMLFNTDSKDVLILDANQAKLNPTEVYRKLESTARYWQQFFSDLGIPYKVRWEEEPGSAGKRESHYTLSPMLVGIDARGVRSTGDKISRARPLAAYAEHGHAKLLRGQWNEAWLMHMHNQPAEHDDMMDAASGAFDDLVQNRINKVARSYQG